MALTEKKLAELKVEALEKADKLLGEIINSYKQPDQKLEGEALAVYRELEDWNWLEDYPLDDPNSYSVYKRMIAMTQFRHIRWSAEHPEQDKKLSKWEVVMNKIK